MFFRKSGRGLVRAAFMLPVVAALSIFVTGSAMGELIGHWALDDGQSDPGSLIAVDSSGKGHDGELTEFVLEPFWVEGKYGGAIELGGETGAIVADMGDDLPLGKEPRTVAAWINLDSPTQAFFASYGAGGGGGQFSIGVESNDGIPNIRLRHGGGSMFFEGEVPEFEWTHIAAVVPDSAEVTGDVLMYLNGEQVISESPNDVAFATAMSSFTIGGKWGVPTNRAFEGQIDDVWIFDEALDQATIVGIMNGEGFTPTLLPGDCNGDGVLDAGDLACLTAETRDSTLASLGLLAGDLDGSGDVGFPDFLVLSANFGNTVDNYTQGDVDLDGSVGFPDFLVLSANFGQAAAATSVPEPSSATLLVMGGLLAGLVRRRRI